MHRFIIPAILGLLVAVVPSVAYADDGCAQPAAFMVLDDGSGHFAQGRGSFSCNHVVDVASRVGIWRTNSTGDYQLIDSSGWVERGRIGDREEWITRTNWVSALCGNYSIRATVRFRYDAGDALTERVDFHNYPAICTNRR